MVSTVTLSPRDRLHQLIDELTDQEAEHAEALLSIEFAEFADEPLTPEDIAAIDEGRSELDRGETVSLTEIRRQMRRAG